MEFAFNEINVMQELNTLFNKISIVKIRGLAFEIGYNSEFRCSIIVDLMKCIQVGDADDIHPDLTYVHFQERRSRVLP